jgi:DNA repair exonuclease SbcCD ATPase subunit
MFGGENLISAFLLLNVFVLGIVLTLAYTHWRAHRSPEQSTVGKKGEMPMLPHDIRQRIIEEAEGDYEKVLRKSAVAFEKDLETTTSNLSQQLEKIGHDIMADEMERYKSSLSSLSNETAKQLDGADAEIETHQQELRKKLAERQAEMDTKLAEHQYELQEKLVERSNAIEAEFKEIQTNYAKKQADLEADLARRESELLTALKTRETELAQHQADLESELTSRQQAHAAKQIELEARLEQEMATRRDAYVKQLDAKLSDSVIAFLSEALGQQVDLGAQTTYLTSVLEQHKDELKQGIEG